jgi:DivIVA domain-containing protein
MRCRECAARVAATARVCSRCGAPIVGQPPAVADTVVDAVSDTAGKAVPAGVAGQALPEAYVPGSGHKLPAELRLVLGGYVGIACGWFATALACVVAAVFVFFDADIRSAVFVFSDADIDADPDVIMDLIMVAALFIPVVGLVCLLGFAGVVTALERIRFSRLLRRPSDPRTATVMAAKRGGRTLILDIIPRDGIRSGYQSLSEVRLALWAKAGMLVPGETVNVYGGSSGKSELLISSPHRSRVFLGTLESQSVLQPRLLDEKVSGATLVDWAAWAASTTFSYTGLRFGYDKPEVDAFCSAVRDTFLGVGEPSVRSDDVRGKQFSTHRLREGYDATEVDAFLEAAAQRLAAMESTDRPTGPLLVSGAVLIAWAEWADSATFSKPRIGHGPGYRPEEVDAFREKIRDTFLGVRKRPLKADKVRGRRFSSPSSEESHGYDEKQVDAFLDAAGIRLAAMESTDKPEGPLVSGAIFAKWADSSRFSTSRLRAGRYDRAEVDAFREAVRDTFLGVGRSPLTWRAPPGQQFTATRGLRPGYDPEQVDAFLDEAEHRLAAMESTDRPPEPLLSGTILTDGPSGPTQQDFQPPQWAEWVEWAEWADSTRFSIPKRSGYEMAEVDAFRQEIRDTFLGVSESPLTLDDVRDKRFRMARRRGYDVVQVDAFCDEAEQKLAAMRPTSTGRRD